MIAVLLGLVLSSCRTSATVSLRADETGAGVVGVDVVLDADATKGLGTGKGQLLTRDLADAGWLVIGIEPSDTGGSKLHAEKAFANPAQANLVLQELTGPTGAMSSLKLTRKQTLTGSRLVLSGSVDLREGLGAFGDPNLKALTGSDSNLGIDDAEIARQSGGKLTDAFRMRFSARVIDSAKDFDVALGSQQAISLSANRFAYEGLAGIAAMIVSLVGLVLLLASIRNRAD